MPDTITAFNVFTQNTKARAAQVNENFANYRGTLLPISTDTATASNLQHDFGASSHRWRLGYISKLYVGDTTTSWSIEDETATSNDLLFKKNGAEVFRIGKNMTLGSVITVQGFSLTSEVTIASSLIVFPVKNAPIEYSFIADDINGGYISLSKGTTTSQALLQLSLWRNGTRIQMLSMGSPGSTGVSTRYPASVVRFIDNSATSYTTSTYYITGSMSNANNSGFIENFRAMVRSLY